MVGDLVSVELRPARVMEFKEGFWYAKRVVQGVYIGCEVVKQDRFLRILGADDPVTVIDARHVQDVRVVASIAGSVEHLEGP